MNDILFGNNNKAVIKKLANRSFRSNKMRNVIAVIAIALTTFLFTAVLTIGMGAKGTLEYNMAKMIGTGADAAGFGISWGNPTIISPDMDLLRKLLCKSLSRY